VIFEVCDRRVLKISELQFHFSFSFLALPQLGGGESTDMPPKRKGSNNNPDPPAKKSKVEKIPGKKAKSSVKGS
jgi:hypothetical protein